MTISFDENLTQAIDQVLPVVEKATVLFVDDEPQILMMLRAIFRGKYDVLTATSGKEALEIVKQQKIHAIVSDQRMPGMLGHQLLHQVKEISPHTMRMILTGYSDLSSIIDSINEGEVFRFIHKPWKKAEIRGIVDSAVEIAMLTEKALSQQLSAVSPNKTSNVDIAKTNGAGVLVIDRDAAIYHQVGEIIAPDKLLLRAKDVDQALNIMDQEEIGLIIAEVAIGDEELTDFIKVMKQEYPLIMTALLTDELDSDTAIGLINEGQVYRYLRKPVSNTMLNLTIKQGLLFYDRNKMNPNLLQRHKVEKTEVRNRSFFNRLLGGLSKLKMRFKFG